MTDATRVSITATAEIALQKLKKAEIGVYDCKKDGAHFIFSVKDKHLKKVFAIFSNPCYNISVTRKSKRAKLLTHALNRIGLIAGAVIFALIAFFSNAFIFKIKVSGSGSYLSPEVRRIVYEAGAKEFKFYSGFDAPLATGKILALPDVTFCNIEKHGSILHVDVEVDAEHNSSAVRTPLVSDCSGVVKNITAICGTAAVSVGDSVNAGDVLISAFTLAGETQIDCLAVGYAEIECKGTAEYPADCESDENLKSAYSSILLEGGEITSRTHTVKQTDDGVVYIIDFSYLHKLSINIE